MLRDSDRVTVTDRTRIRLEFQTFSCSDLRSNFWTLRHSSLENLQMLGFFFAVMKTSVN